MTKYLLKGRYPAEIIAENLVGWSQNQVAIRYRWDDTDMVAIVHREELKPAPAVVYANVYRPEGSKGPLRLASYTSRQTADEYADDDRRIACIRIEIEEGRFDD